MSQFSEPSLLRAKPRAPSASLHGSLKSALAVLVLVLLGLLFWLLFDQYQRDQDELRQRALDNSARLADHVSMNMALFAQTTLNRLMVDDVDPTNVSSAERISRLAARVPDLHSIAWIKPDGQVLDSANVPAPPRDWAKALEAARNAAYYFSNSVDGRWAYLFLREPGNAPSGHWLLRFEPHLFATLSHHVDSQMDLNWLLENRQSQAVTFRSSNTSATDLGLSPAEKQKTVMIGQLPDSDWQVRTLFDANQSRNLLLPALITKLVLGLICAIVPLITLVNLRRRQYELNEGRRRYQHIFQGAGVGLCVLDLTPLRDQLAESGVSTPAALDQWLLAEPERRRALAQLIKVTEVNQVALHFLGVHTNEQVSQRLLEASPLDPANISHQLACALLDQTDQVELEIELRDQSGVIQHVWTLANMPEPGCELAEAILSLRNITQRKQAELSLAERESFWSDVVRTVPDHLYVGDVKTRRMLYSNHHLAETLGYSPAEIEGMGEQFWEVLVHPEDAEVYHRLRQDQRAKGYAVQLHCQLRFVHKHGHWRRFDIREQTLASDENGQVLRVIGVAKDITEQVEASQSLRDSEQRYRLLAESISDVIFSTDSRLKLNYISPSMRSVLGYEVEAMYEQWQSVIANPGQLGVLQKLLERVSNALDHPEQLAELRTQVQTQFFVFDCLRADGRKIPMELRLALVWNELDQFEGILGVGRDISQQRRAEKDLRMAATVFEHSTSAILITDPAGYIVQANEAFSRVTGYGVGQVLDQLPGMLTVSDQQEAHLSYVVKQLHQRGSWEGEVWLKRRNGEHYPAWVGITAVLDDEGDLASYVCFFSDISERKASEQRIHRLAYYDALTHLPNRTLFQDRLHNALQHAERQKSWVVLMFLDLDRFKPINDSLGHAAGDRMLKDMAMRLLACVDDDDTVARMGGDEFTLLLQPTSRENALNRAIHVAEQILASLVKPFVLEGREFFVTASIGIALSPQDGNELSQLMKNADTAMYHAKERGKNNFQFYQADMNASALERLELESDLRHALEQKEFVLYYQPQFSGDGKRLTGTEALLRWRHPRRGLVPPGDFIPVLEELGLVVDVGDWVLEEACRQLKTWHQARVRVPKVSVNISARQFSDGQLGNRIANILKETGLPPACLELELTESILMREVNEAMQILDSLKFLGLSIAVDDFGTGYSSLNYLKQFPIDVLKIDRTFVDGLPEGEQDAQIARAIIAMAHSLNLAVIAEGVETQEQLDFLREHGCDEVQGYLFGRPMQASRFEAQFSNDALFMFE